jgi:3-methyladenine DNA glycosylase Tag
MIKWNQLFKDRNKIRAKAQEGQKRERLVKLFKRFKSGEIFTIEQVSHLKRLLKKLESAKKVWMTIFYSWKTARTQASTSMSTNLIKSEFWETGISTTKQILREPQILQSKLNQIKIQTLEESRQRNLLK